jgi:hypothetical protein
MAVLFILAVVVLAIAVWRQFRKPAQQIPAGLKALPGPKGI